MLIPSSALAAFALATTTPTPASAQASNGITTTMPAQNDVAANASVPSDNVVADAPVPAEAKEAGETNAANAEDSTATATATDTDQEGSDEWGWLKVIVGGLVGAAGVLATQWITARTNRVIAREQAEISRSAVQVAADALLADQVSHARPCVAIARCQRCSVTKRVRLPAPQLIAQAWCGQPMAACCFWMKSAN